MTALAHYDFDTVLDRRSTHSIKWNTYPEDVLPLWVADMDFRSAPEIIEALQKRVEHGVFGYTATPEVLREIIVQRMQDLYQWKVEKEEVLFFPGMVLSLNLVAHVVGKVGDGVMMNTPVYGPFLTAPENQERFAQLVDMQRVADDDQAFHYEIDFAAFEQAISKQSSLYYLCDPHNPGGKTLTEAELQRIGKIAQERNLMVCADSIHCDLVLSGTPFKPLASLSDDIAQQTITLIAPTKTYNIPGLACSVAIVKNEVVREALQKRGQRSGYHVDLLAYEAAIAAYRDGNAWLESALDYIRANRDYTVQFFREHLPMLKFIIPEATYLMWIDCGALPLRHANYHDFFEQAAKVALNKGDFFSPNSQNFVRLNLACPRSILVEALERMKAAIERL